VLNRHQDKSKIGTVTTPPAIACPRLAKRAQPTAAPSKTPPKINFRKVAYDFPPKSDHQGTTIHHASTTNSPSKHHAKTQKITKPPAKTPFHHKSKKTQKWPGKKPGHQVLIRFIFENPRSIPYTPA
jgi:hypothetical protein